jgi:hypothetical protein
MSMVDELGQQEHTQTFYQDLAKLKGLLPNKEDRPLYRHWIYRFTSAGQSYTVATDSGYPDYWLVYAIQATESTLIQVFQAGSVGGEAEVILSGGGSCRIPATSEYLSILAQTIGASGLSFGILAVRKVPFDIFVNP